MSINSTIRPYYTICLDIKDKPCIIVGGGEVASRRAASLFDSGGIVTIISPKVDPILEFMSSQNEIKWIKKEYSPALIKNDPFLVIAATNDRAVNQEVAKFCQKREILCNVVDEPSEGNFIVPSKIDRGPLTITVSTSGISPSMAATIRQELETVYGEEYGILLELIAKYRPVIQEEVQDPILRQKIFRSMVTAKVLELIDSGKIDEAQQELSAIVQSMKLDAVS